MDVLILSKTKYGNTQVCVGGIGVGNKQFIRLLNNGGFYQPANTSFNVGDIWEVAFTQVVHKREPHNEDVTIHGHNFVRKVYNIETYIKGLGVNIWQGSVLNIFDAKLKWTRLGKGYLSANNVDYPCHSVGFWISDVALVYENGNYVYRDGSVVKQIVYKGNQQVLPIIPAGKLIRLSLAKWWKPDHSTDEERCYLQLSGWYDDILEPKAAVIEAPIVKTQPTVSSYELPKPRPNPEFKPSIPVGYQLPKQQPPIVTAGRTPSTQNPQNSSGPCYIATLCYGDYHAEQVCSFRDFRDNYLKKYTWGKRFISNYYLVAPKVTAVLAGHKTVNLLIKLTVLNPILSLIKLLALDKNRSVRP